jgi:hypothetical protein
LLLCKAAPAPYSAGRKIRTSVERPADDTCGTKGTGEIREDAPYWATLWPVVVRSPSRLRSHQSIGMLSAKNVVMEVCNPLLPCRGRIEVSHTRAYML